MKNFILITIFLILSISCTFLKKTDTGLCKAEWEGFNLYEPMVTLAGEPHFANYMVVKLDGKLTEVLHVGAYLSGAGFIVFNEGCSDRTTKITSLISGSLITTFTDPDGKLTSVPKIPDNELQQFVSFFDRLFKTFKTELGIKKKLDTT